MKPSPPDLFPQRPIRSDFGRVPPSYRLRRFITILICLGIIGGIAYRFYGRPSTPPGEVPTIKADTAAWKQKPEQPGGIDIPHQDVQVYEALDNKDNATPPVEHLLPPPETPQASTAPVIATNPAPSPAQSPAQNPAPLKTETLKDLTPIDAAPPPPPPVQTTVESHPASAPAQQVKAAPAPAPAPVASAKKKPAPEQSSAKSGPVDHAVQLASVQDEGSAHAMMEKFQSQYASVLGDTQLHLVKADLGSKGIFYRIRSQSLTEDQANRICNSLKKMKAGCILVR